MQTAVLAALIGFRQWTLETGTPVVLAIRPVDPRSLFQGDYVRLSYEIGHLRIDRLAGDDDLERGETVFVDLQPGRPAWQATGVWRQRPVAAPTGAVLRGRVEWVAEQRCEESGTGKSTVIVPCRIAGIRYGIESYFVPEGTGREWERPAEGGADRYPRRGQPGGDAGDLGHSGEWPAEGGGGIVLGECWSLLGRGPTCERLPVG